jgi:hypothetical protein
VFLLRNVAPEPALLERLALVRTEVERARHFSNLDEKVSASLTKPIAESLGVSKGSASMAARICCDDAFTSPGKFFLWDAEQTGVLRLL